MISLSDIISPGWTPAIGLAALLVLLVSYVRGLAQRPDELAVPTLTEEGGDFHKIMKRGYNEHKKRLYKIPTSNKPMVIVPADMLDDLKAQPESTISFRREMYDRYLGKYTAVASNSSTMIHSVKVDLTRGLPHILPVMQEEARFATEQCLEGAELDGDGWFRTTVYGACTQMIALISGRVFVGLPLSRNKEWIDISINATIDSFVGAAMMWKYPSWSWPIMQYIVPQTKRVQYYRTRVAQILKPLIDARLQAMQDDPDLKKPEDMIQWFIDNSNGKSHDMAFQANEHIVVNVAAIHTTGGQLAHTLYDLARFPQYIPMLREEMEQVLAEEGGTGVLTKQTLFKLKKMDSFLREVQRVSPPSMVSTNRKVLKPMKLSDGTELPVGTSLAASAGCVSKDPELWHEPEKFDGLRFYELRKEHGDEKYQFASANKDALSFGHGRHACPGRFFASAELKVLLVQILQNYDVDLCKDYSRDRPLNFHVEIMAAQDHTYELRFRKRVEGAKS
ncbi:hypothetical protein QQS21_000399 [Conoideocrella luteorostrata]|uniref:Cytochrome P450 n=1 Tax=Conoideocrella luteorostrata TaxID=1105319 RepID=A0AAJ0CYT3_9HYPO|nr:hypothetical protein QQS21_000399 [Conoideocrella luteorostrata]